MNVYDENIRIAIEREKESITVPFFDLKAGDHAQTSAGLMIVCGSDAHVSGDADYDGWIVYDESGDGYFPEDFGAPLKSNL